MKRTALIVWSLTIGGPWWDGAAASASQSPSRPCVDRSGKAPRVLFRDDGARRPDFNEFRRRLRDATSRRDIAAVTAILYPQIQVDFGGSSGPDAFKETHVNSPDEDFWTEFAGILAMGGRFSTPDTFAAPYAFTEIRSSAWSSLEPMFECASVRLQTRRSSPASIAWSFRRYRTTILLTGGGVSRPPTA
jgi:hypothetical protein